MHLTVVSTGNHLNNCLTITSHVLLVLTSSLETGSSIPLNLISENPGPIWRIGPNNPHCWCSHPYEVLSTSRIWEVLTVEKKM